MGARGATKLSKLKVDKRPSRMVKGEFTPTLLSRVPAAPKEFSNEQAATWRKISKELLLARILSSIDLNLLYDYCVFESYIRACQKIINEKGQLVKGKENPAAGMLNRYSVQLRSIGAVLGVGALNRTKIGGAKPPQKKAKGFDDLLK